MNQGSSLHGSMKCLKNAMRKGEDEAIGKVEARLFTRFPIQCQENRFGKNSEFYWLISYGSAFFRVLVREPNFRLLLPPQGFR